MLLAWACHDPVSCVQKTKLSESNGGDPDVEHFPQQASSTKSVRFVMESSASSCEKRPSYAKNKEARSVNQSGKVRKPSLNNNGEFQLLSPPSNSEVDFLPTENDKLQSRRSSSNQKEPQVTSNNKCGTHYYTLVKRKVEINWPGQKKNVERCQGLNVWWKVPVTTEDENKTIYVSLKQRRGLKFDERWTRRQRLVIK